MSASAVFSFILSCRIVVPCSIVASTGFASFRVALMQFMVRAATTDRNVFIPLFPDACLGLLLEP
jgi:hypothetical protein